MDSTAKRICDVIATELGVDARDVKYNSRIVEDLGADSLDVVELTMGLEEEFGIEIDDELELETVEEYINYVKGATGE